MLPLIRNYIKDTLQSRLTANGFIWKLPKNDTGTVCLTFDDGPDPVFTIPILKLLESHNIKATFFLIGEKVKLYPEIAKAIVTKGHCIAGHTYRHIEITTMSNRKLRQELYQTREIFKEITGKDCVTFRPPRGTMSLRTLLVSLLSGYKMIHWSKTYSDYLLDGSEKLIQRMSSNPVHDRDIILLHDNNPFTLQSLTHLINDIKFKNFKYAVINEEGVVVIQGS